MMEKLKPCPFCGGPVNKMEVYRDRNYDVINVVVICENAGCHACTVFIYEEFAKIQKLCPVVSKDGIDESAKLCAAQQWNRRVE